MAQAGPHRHLLYDCRELHAPVLHLPQRGLALEHDICFMGLRHRRHSAQGVFHKDPACSLSHPLSADGMAGGYSTAGVMAKHAPRLILPDSCRRHRLQRRSHYLCPQEAESRARRFRFSRHLPRHDTGGGSAALLACVHGGDGCALTGDSYSFRGEFFSEGTNPIFQAWLVRGVVFLYGPFGGSSGLLRMGRLCLNRIRKASCC